MRKNGSGRHAIAGPVVDRRPDQARTGHHRTGRSSRWRPGIFGGAAAVVGLVVLAVGGPALLHVADKDRASGDAVLVQGSAPPTPRPDRGSADRGSPDRVSSPRAASRHSRDAPPRTPPASRPTPSSSPRAADRSLPSHRPHQTAPSAGTTPAVRAPAAKPTHHGADPDPATPPRLVTLPQQPLSSASDSAQAAVPQATAASDNVAPLPRVSGDTSARMTAALNAARLYWHKVPDCPQGMDTFLPVPDGAIGEAQKPGCSMGISASGYALPDRIFCKDVVHEFGHLLGHDHTSTGIMAPVIDPTPSIPSCNAAFPEG